MSSSRPPSVDSVIRALVEEGAPRGLAAYIARSTVEGARPRLLAGEQIDVTSEARAALEALIETRHTELVNATGVLLHTNLGRAPLHPAAAERAAQAATTYTNLEFDLRLGTRGKRAHYVSELLIGLTGAGGGLVVNNNAGGLFLVLAALARDRPVPVSRGELIEIGGSYRLPDLMAASGAHLREVGTTNRTRITDYEQAISPETAALLKVHPSNYRIVGFAEEVPVASLAPLAKDHLIPLIFDVGSGLLDEDVPWLSGPPPPWLEGEPGVRQSLTRGASLVLFSGDKLLGGPQAGIIVGETELIQELARHPISRALRPDGPTLSALESTLEMYSDGRGGEIPFWKMATTSPDVVADRARTIIAEIDATLVEGESVLGAGSVPGKGIPTPVIAVRPADPEAAWQQLLRAGIVPRREAGQIMLDLRAVAPEADPRIREALVSLCRS